MKNQQGQTLIEVLVALAIALITATAFVSLSTVTVKNSNSSTNQSTATQLAQQGIEQMISLRDQNGLVEATKWSEITPQPACGDVTAIPSAASVRPCGDYVLSTSCSVGTVCLTAPSTVASYQVSSNTAFSQLIRVIGGDERTVTSLVWWSDSSGVHKSVVSRIIGRDKIQ